MKNFDVSQRTKPNLKLQDISSKLQDILNRGIFMLCS